MTGKNVTLPEEVSRTEAPKGDRSKACREKSAEAIVLPEWSAGRAETYGGDAEGHQNDHVKTAKFPPEGYLTNRRDGIESKR